MLLLEKYPDLCIQLWRSFTLSARFTAWSGTPIVTLLGRPSLIVLSDRYAIPSRMKISLTDFASQNIAEIDEIPWTDKLEEIVLPAAERAIYLELEHHLRALDMTIKRGRKTESDREKRLAKAMGESK
jgi:hypothetical protein